MVNGGNWWGDTDNKIVNIPISNKPPSWASSTPTPEWQLRDLGQKGSFVSQ